MTKQGWDVEKARIEGEVQVKALMGRRDGPAMALRMREETIVQDIVPEMYE